MCVYIYIYIYIYAKWYYFCRKVWVWMQEIIFVERCERECKKIGKVSGEIFPKLYAYSTQSPHLLSPFFCPKSLPHNSFSWLHQAESPALFPNSFPCSLFLSSPLLTWQPSLSHQKKKSLSKEEIKGLTLKFQLQIVGGK